MRAPCVTRSDGIVPVNDKILPAEKPEHLGLLLAPGFSLMSYASVIEPFRAANVLAGKQLYRWTHVSTDGEPVTASNGATILADGKVGDRLDCETLFVIAAGEPAKFDHQPTFAWLRQLAASGVRLAGVSGGPLLLAKAGLLEGYRATVHWEHWQQMHDLFPDLSVESGLYVIDRRRLTCAGGIAALDLAVEMIERAHGHALASRVGEWFISPEQRPPDKAQRIGLRERYGIANDRVLKVLARMEESTAEPLTHRELAGQAGVSLRQLERLFARDLGSTIGAVYLGIRLDKAQELLRKTGMQVTAVAFACGFRNSSHFSRAYRARFGQPPSRR